VNRTLVAGTVLALTVVGLLGGRLGAGESPAEAARALAEQLARNPVPPSKGADRRVALFLLDVETKAVTRIADEPEPGLFFCASPDWSHDGTRIAFDAAPVYQSDFHRTRLQSLHRGEKTPVLTRLGFGNCPTVTREGDRVVFFLNPGVVPGAEGGLWIMGADGSDRRHLGEFGRPKLSPDGRRIMIASFGTPRTLELIELATGKIRQPELPGKQVFSYPSWAGHDSIVAVVGGDGGNGGDAVALLDVSDPEELTVRETLWTRAAGPDVVPILPVYSPETRRCVFIGQGPKGSALYEVRRGTPGPATLLERRGYDRMLVSLFAAPGGRYLIFCSDRPDPEPR
jgi:hypothetical protein